MLHFGKSITTPGDPLQPLPVERLYRAILQPKQEFRDLLEQLRMVRSLDENKYRELKKQLPYFVCGLFHPPVRRKENFASIAYFMVDLDHLSKASLGLETLRERMKEIPEVLLCFASPSGDGLKIMFHLADDCRDSALFSAFYKVFVRRFAESHGLLEVVDFHISDVTRACFLSYDPDAFYRPDAQQIDIASHLPELDFGKAEKEIREAEKVLRMNQPNTPRDSDVLDSEILQRIRLKLNPLTRTKTEKQYYVPPQVEEALGILAEKFASYEIQIYETSPISYGRQIKVKAGTLWAEINLFYGKHGFRVVKTTKTGSNQELAEIAVLAMTEILNEFRG